MKRLSLIIAAVALYAAASAEISSKLNGYIGSRIDSCIENMVKARDTEPLVEPFRHLGEKGGWQTEFVGKWMLGAMASYRYNHDPELLEKINNTVTALIATQHSDGYIGNYELDDRLNAGWDIWGRKYTSLALLDHYALTGEKSSLEAARRLIDGLMNELKSQNKDIASTGNYRGMPSSSILEPVMYLYRASGDSRYLDFACYIGESLDSPDGPGLVTKALKGVPVAHRFDFPKNWWTYENGQKAYEMMSCYVGLIELGKTIGRSDYIQAACAVADNILATEINIAGSGAAFECWYNGKDRQTTPAYHTMETCVTFTWMQFLNKLWQHTHQSRYVDEFERTMYNALMAALKDDAHQISKYSPLEGRRQAGEEQCGLPINCCSANGPRAFAMIPDFAVEQSADTIWVNLYLPGTYQLESGRNKISLDIKPGFPVSGNASISMTMTKQQKMVMALRVPGWSHGHYSVTVDGTQTAASDSTGYIYVSRKFGRNTEMALDFALDTRLVELNGMQSVVRGPLVFARDSRFGDGYVDECCVIQADGNGIVETRFAENPVPWAWVTLEVPAVLGTDLEDPANSTVKYMRMCDFSSAGSDWCRTGRYRVWLTKTLNAMAQPYQKY